MRVVWMRSGFFLPAFFCCLSFWRIESSRSLTESVPTLSLMRCRGIGLILLLVEQHHLAAVGRQHAAGVTFRADELTLDVAIERIAAGGIGHAAFDLGRGPGNTLDRSRNAKRRDLMMLVDPSRRNDLAFEQDRRFRRHLRRG